MLSVTSLLLPPSVVVPRRKNSPRSPRVVTSETTSEAATYTSYRKTPTLQMSFSSAACSSSLYEVLGISMGASGDEIKSAYRKLARVIHPDVAARDTSFDEFIELRAAYSTLSDPLKRAEYDRSLFRRHRSFPGGYVRRSWETDQCW